MHLGGFPGSYRPISNDYVSEVVNLPRDQVDPIPPSIASIDAEYLSGVGKMGKRIVILLDLAKLLGDIERVAIEELGKKDTGKQELK